MQENYLKNEDLYHTLDTINMWINNCDTKASIILSIIGVVFSILFSSDYIRIVKRIFEKSLLSFKGIMILYDLIVFISLVLLFVGIWLIVLCIIPKVSLGRKALFFLRKHLPISVKNKLIRIYNLYHNKIESHRKKRLDEYSKAVQQSFTFYGAVALKDFDNYKTELASRFEKNDDLVNDLIFQIYSASCICNTKFSRFKHGMCCLAWGIVLFTLQMIIGYYYIY